VPLAVLADVIRRQSYELSKQLQESRLHVTVRSKTNLKLHERFFIPNHTFIEMNTSQAENAERPL
jgi:hypothetical protein